MVSYLGVGLENVAGEGHVEKDDEGAVSTAVHG